MSPMAGTAKLEHNQAQTRKARLQREQLELLRTLRKPGEWAAQAACQDYDRDTFYPLEGHTPRTNHTNALPALAICAMCPVRSDCLDFAMATREPYGVWGGMTAAERARLQRRATRR